MFGAILRAAPFAAMGALLSAVLARVMAPMLDVMAGGDYDPSGHMLYEGLVAATNNFLLVIGLGIVLGLIAKAVLEARLGGVGR